MHNWVSFFRLQLQTQTRPILHILHSIAYTNLYFSYLSLIQFIEVICNAFLNLNQISFGLTILNSSIYSKEIAERVCMTCTTGIVIAPLFLIHLKSTNIDNCLRKLEYEASIGNEPWIFIGRTDGEAEAPILWSPEAKSWLIGKDPDAGKDWELEEKAETEDENPPASAEDMGLIPGPGKCHMPLCN